MKKLFFISMLFSGAMHVNGMNIDNNAFGAIYATNQQQDEQIEISVEKILKEMGFTEAEKLSKKLNRNIIIAFRNSNESGTCPVMTTITFPPEAMDFSKNFQSEKFTVKESKDFTETINKIRNNALKIDQIYCINSAPQCFRDLHNRIQQWFKGNHNNEGEYTLDKNQINKLATMIQRTVKNSRLEGTSNFWQYTNTITLGLDNYEALRIDTYQYDENITFLVYPKNSTYPRVGRQYMVQNIY